MPKQSYRKWVAGPKYPGCSCCRKDSKKKCAIAVNRYERRAMKQSLKQSQED